MNKQIFSFISLTILIVSMFTSCNKNDDDYEYVVSGTIPSGNWSEVSVSYDIGKTWAATVPVSTVATLKQFKIKLPVPKSELKPITDSLLGILDIVSAYDNLALPNVFKTILSNGLSGLSDIITPSNENSKASVAVFYARNNDLQAMIAQFSITTMSIVQYMYVDTDVNVNGKFDQIIEVEETSTPVKLEYSMQLKKGWNTVLVSINATDAISGAVTMTTKTAAVPTGSVWTTF